MKTISDGINSVKSTTFESLSFTDKLLTIESSTKGLVKQLENVTIVAKHDTALDKVDTSKEGGKENLSDDERFWNFINARREQLAKLHSGMRAFHQIRHLVQALTGAKHQLYQVHIRIESYR